MASGNVRKTAFSAPYPVTATVEVTALYHPDLMVEIIAIPQIPPERFNRLAKARAMHGADSGR